MIRIITASVIEGLRRLEDESVNCVVTSPPYYGLRDYGLDPVVWGGDSECDHVWADALRHTGGSGRQGATSARIDRQNVAAQEKVRDADNVCEYCGAWRGHLGLEPNHHLYVAHMVAIFREIRRVLRPDGVVWLNLGDSYANDGKWGGMTGGKQAYLDKKSLTIVGREKRRTGLKPKDLIGIPWRVAFALQDDGWWLRQDIIWHKPNPMPESVRDRCTKAHEYIFMLTKAQRYFYDADAIREPFSTDCRENYPERARITGRGTQAAADARGNDRDKSGGFPPRNEGRNKRSVWTVTTEPFREAHFATFPPALIEPCILAGAPRCEDQETNPGTVLDPFAGAGTVGLVASRHGRNAVLIELNPDYAEMARQRIEADGALLNIVEMDAP